MLKETPLAKVHAAMGGKMVDFGGWSMPVNYGSQIEEHHAVRRDAGMFDVSHMTIVDVHGEDAKRYLSKLLANDVAKLQSEGKALYSAMLNPQGGVKDDLIVYLMPFGYRVVVNCATREKDLAWMNDQAQEFEVELKERSDLAMIAVQGPKTRVIFDQLLTAEQQELVGNLGVFSGQALELEGREYFVARTGYTGEDGYEVMLPNEQAAALWQKLHDLGVKPCGLGARDTLRLEAGMNLYGHEMDEDTSPLVANMAWTVAMGGDRDFIGCSALQTEKDTGVKEKLVGLLLQTRGVLREGYTVIVPESSREGVITSGSFSPTLGCSIALARVPIETQAKAQVNVRGKMLDVEVVKPCFVRFGEPV